MAAAPASTQTSKTKATTTTTCHSWRQLKYCACVLCSGSPSRGGRLAVVFRHNLIVRRHPLSDSLSPRTFEAQLVRVGLPPSSHTVLHIYTPQWKSTVAEFVDELSDVIASLNANSTDNLIVCGDVNCPGPTPSSVDVALAEMLDSLGLTQLVGLLRVAAEVILCAV